MKQVWLGTLRISSILLLSTYTFNTLAADYPDAKLFGVQIDMKGEIALDAMAKHFKVNPKSLEGKITGKRETGLRQVFSYRDSSGIEATVSLDGADGHMKVNKIQYQIPYNKNNTQLLKEQSISKYGPPTAVAMGTLYWCKNPKKPAQEYQKCINKKNETTIRLYENKIIVDGNKTRMSELYEKSKEVKPSF